MTATLYRILKSMVVAAALLIATTASAQTGAASIAGQARDTSGAVLPGVTVEASSPALIEKIRTVTTDEQGQAQVPTAPGTYTVTFSLGGFSSFKREGIALPASFTATVNAELTIGSLEETITVSGASPVVDVQNAVPRSRSAPRHWTRCRPTKRSRLLSR